MFERPQSTKENNKNRRRLTFFYYGDWRFRYGVAEVIMSIIRKIDSSHFEVTLVVNGELDEKQKKEIAQYEVFIVELKEKSLKKCFLKWVRFIFKNKPNIVFSATEHPNILLSVLRILFLFRYHLIISVHSPLSKRFNNMWGRRSSMYIMSLVRFSYRFADKVVCVSDYVAKDTKKYSVSNNIVRIYNPVKINSNPALIDSHTPGRKLLVVSRLVANKRIEDAIVAVSINQNVERLDIVGDGPLLTTLKRLSRKLKIENRVFFHGYVEDPSLFYKAADVVILSSEWEGFGNIVVEAMSYGCQVIVNQDSGSPPELLKNGKFGWLYCGGDPNHLSSKIDCCLKAPIPGDKLYEYATEFSEDRIGKIYSDLIFDVEFD